MKVLIVLCLAALAAADYDPGYAPPPVAAYDPGYAPRPEPSRVCCSPKLGKQCLPVVCEPNKKPCNPCVCPPKQPCQPVVCPPHGGVCQLAEIYYRYNIKYPCENCASQGKEESIGAYGVKGSYYANLPHSQTYLSYDIPRAENWLGPSGR